MENLLKLELGGHDCKGLMYSLDVSEKPNYHDFYKVENYELPEDTKAFDHPAGGFVILSRKVVESFTKIITEDYMGKSWSDDMTIGEVLNSVDYSPVIRSFDRHEFVFGYTQKTYNYYSLLKDVTKNTISVHLQNGLKNYSQMNYIKGYINGL